MVLGEAWVWVYRLRADAAVRPRGLKGLQGLNPGRVLGQGWCLGPPMGAPFMAPSFPGLLCVSSDSHRCDRHPALHLPSLLQPVHPVVFPKQKRPFL